MNIRILFKLALFFIALQVALPVVSIFVHLPWWSYSGPPMLIALLLLEAYTRFDYRFGWNMQTFKEATEPLRSLFR